MITTLFDDLSRLVETCHELRLRLNEAREKLTEEQFEALYDGPFDEILCAAMDVEDALLECDGL